mgnify:CR=1 FL=1
MRQTIDDLCQPFMDFRERGEIIRSPDAKDDHEKYNIIVGPTPCRLTSKELFYCLVDETERTFRAGMIVQATVIRSNGPGKLLCRLDNGLDASVHENDADVGQ